MSKTLRGSSLWMDRILPGIWFLFVVAWFTLNVVKVFGASAVLNGVGAAIGALGSYGLLASLVQWFGESRRQVREEADRKKEKAARLHLFALEAVELEERWVQYVRQARLSDISRSSPFELTTPDQVNELLKLGVSETIVRAVYFVKELTNDVRRSVQRAQDEAAHLNTLPVDTLAGLSPQQREVPNETFNSASAFIKDRWTRAAEAVGDILTAARKVDCQVDDLIRRHLAHGVEYRALVPSTPRSTAEPARESQKASS
jgi:hypothetical protein